MEPLDALWHLLNFFLPALGVGLTGAALAKLIWRRELKGVAYARLAAFGVAANALVLVGGLLLTGRDGRMSTYAAMVAACAAALLWGGWGPGRR
jgi:hypothetical protein